MWTVPNSEIKADRKIVLAAVEAFGLTLAFASPKLKNDPAIVRAALKQNASALIFASPKLQRELKKG